MEEERMIFRGDLNKSPDKVVYAIILNYNSASESISLFKNLEGQKLPYLKILVIDNNSMKEDKIQLKENLSFQNLILNEKNLGYAGGNNIGIEIALNEQADYIWVLNPDVRVNDQTLPILIKTLSDDKTLAAVGPRIIHRNNRKKIFSDGEILKMDSICSTRHKNHNKEVGKVPKNIDYNIDYIAGSSILLNCKTIEEIGKFPEEYFLYFEETDWCFNAKKHKWKLAVNSHAEVYGLTSVKGEVFNYYFMRNKLIFSKKHHSNFTRVRSFYINEILREIAYRIKGRNSKPYLKDRVKGLVSGIFKTSIK